MQKNLTGLQIIQKFHKTVPNSPGVYRMFDENNIVLYVGKAKNLYNRIKNYTDLNGLSSRIQQMIFHTKSMEIIKTETETEALLLEQDLIKQLHPKYNIMLTDNKSYPYIAISKDFPQRIFKFHGDKNKNNNLFGPFPTVYVLDQTIKLIQNLFGIRICKDTYMKNRSRPCILYQIHRCSGICLNKISDNEYIENMRRAISFLRGNTKDIVDDLSTKMMEASKNQEYETAKIYRDKISYINQAVKQNTFANINIDTDVIVVINQNNNFAIEIMSIKNGSVVGQFSFFPKYDKEVEEVDIFNEFVDKFYTDHQVPKLILTNIATSNIFDTGINVEAPQKGEKKKIIDITLKNAILHLSREFSKSENNKKYMEEIAKLFELNNVPKRIDCFDNSHIFGTDKIGAMIVMGTSGFRKNDYRKYNIKSNVAGDDYTMMNEVLTRRYTRAKVEKTLPDLILVDGGRGQLDIAYNVIRNLDLEIPIVGIAKGENRNAGEETLYQKGHLPINLSKNNPILFFLQRIRDEAHRFAITTHRKKRANSHFRSELDDIEGIGVVKKRNLLNHFGSVKNIINSSVSEIMKVDGINKTLAEKIYDIFHA